jgi:hypothetical protein
VFASFDNWINNWIKKNIGDYLLFPIFLALKYFNPVIFFEKYFIVTMLFLQKMFMIRLKEEYDNNIFKNNMTLLIKHNL